MSISDIWGATDTDVDPDAINVPDDPREAFEMGMHYGLKHNCEIVTEWVAVVIAESMAISMVYSELDCDADDLAAILDCNTGYWMHRSDKLAKMTRFCQVDLKMKRNVSDQA